MSTTVAQVVQKEEEPYRYEHLKPQFLKDTYPPLAPFDHVDPGHRALKHANPRSFLANATSVVDLTPVLGTEVRGVNLAELDSDSRDQVALEVRSFLFIHNISCSGLFMIC
jgi:sulfonate dioxygenase